MALSISVASKWQHANNAPLKNVISVYLSSMTLVTQSVVWFFIFTLSMSATSSTEITHFSFNVLIGKLTKGSLIWQTPAYKAQLASDQF